MVINYQDKGIVVTYLQIFLKEYFNYTVRKVTPRKRSQSSYYEITNNDPLRVTGYYNLQTYSALALYMAYNYPNEGYPIKWDTTTWKPDTENPYYYDGDDDKLKEIIQENMENSLNHEETVQVPERVLSYIFNEVVTPLSTSEEILRVKELIYQTPLDKTGALNYDEDFMEKVKTIQQGVIDRYSTYSEVTELKEVKYDGSQYYFDELGKGFRNAYILKTEEEKQYEKSNRIELYSSEYDSEEGVLIFNNPEGSYHLNVGDERTIVLKSLVKTDLPLQFRDFKVTGYVDPWTEFVIKGGIEFE